jgi:hypothetical protein
MLARESACPLCHAAIVMRFLVQAMFSGFVGESSMIRLLARLP